MAKTVDLRTAQKLQDLYNEISVESYEIIARLAAWRYALAWFSSYERVVKKGMGFETITLSEAQRNEFAFSYSPDKDGYNFYLLIQPSEFEWLSNIKIRTATITNDGLVIFIEQIRIRKIYIAELSFKIPFGLSRLETLSKAKNRAAQLWLVKYNLDDNCIEKVCEKPIEITTKPYEKRKNFKRNF